MKKLALVVAAVGVLLAGCDAAPVSNSDTHQSQNTGPQPPKPDKTQLTRVQELYAPDGTLVAVFGCFGVNGVYWKYDSNPNLLIPNDPQCK